MESGKSLECAGGREPVFAIDRADHPQRAMIGLRQQPLYGALLNFCPIIGSTCG